MKQFEIPEYYRSPIISHVKKLRKENDRRKKDFSPTRLKFDNVTFLISRHFGFCFGVENAIEIAYRAIDENPNKNIFLLSEMIHNPVVNEDLLQRGVKFIQDTSGNPIIDINTIKKEDIVLIPAFGSSIEIENKLLEIGVNIKSYNTTCPFVEKVWKRSKNLGQTNHTIIIHGKKNHEESKATFSRSNLNAPTLIIRDLKEAISLGEYIKEPKNSFYNHFKGCYSKGFDVEKDLLKIGVVNQTTMLATETQEITSYLRNIMIEKYGDKNIKEHIADTRDTLCYATNDNQTSTYEILNKDVDLAIVVGGYNSSNTSHLVELLQNKFETFFIKSEEEILSKKQIQHFDIIQKTRKKSSNYLPSKIKPTIAFTSGASCPDSVIDKVIRKFVSFYDIKEKELFDQINSFG